MNRKRPEQIVIRMSEEERKKIQEKVAESGMSQQEYLIRCALGKKITNLDGLKELTYEIKKIGVNLNQITKKVNQGEMPYSPELANIQKEVNEIWQLLKQLAQKQA